MGVVLLNTQQISADDFKSIQNASASPGNKNAAKVHDMLQNAAKDGGFSEKELRDVAQAVLAGAPKGADPAKVIDAFVDGMKLSDPKLAESLKFEMKDKVGIQSWAGQTWSNEDYGTDQTETTFVMAAPVTEEAAKVTAKPSAISFEPKAADEKPAVTGMQHNRSNGFAFAFEGKDMEITPDYNGGFTADGPVGQVLSDPAARGRLADGIEAAAKGKGEIWEADAKAIAEALRHHPETITQ
jgi:hypothetical protein